MISISLCMIVKNEENTLPICLNSIKEIVDEIILVDTGSTDATKKTAAEYTDKVFDFVWTDDFSEARNYAFSQATKDYILWLDADDYLLPHDLELFKELKTELSEESKKDTQVVMMKYNTGFDKSGRVTFSFFRERLVKRTAGFLWQEPVHEYIQTFGKTIYSEAAITHTVKTRKQAEAKTAEGRNIRIYEGLLKSGKQLTPRGTYYYARELRDVGRYADAARYFSAFLEGKKGWIEDNIAACGALSECLLIMGERQAALTSLLKSFEYDNPRPELCCKIGYYFKLEKRYAQAAHWFLAALRSAEDSAAKGGRSQGFCQQDYYGYVPCIELAVCYSRLGENASAEEYNEKAARFKPDCPSVASNREYFKRIMLPK